MKKKYQNAFFVFGVVVLAVMVTQLDFAQVWQGLRHAGYWFAAVMLLWAALYVLNTVRTTTTQPLTRKPPIFRREDTQAFKKKEPQAFRR